MPSERDLTGFTGMLAPSKLIQPLKGEGGNVDSCLSIPLRVLTALIGLIPGKKNSQLIRMDIILTISFVVNYIRLIKLTKSSSGQQNNATSSS